MDLHTTGWLGELLAAILVEYRPERARLRLSAEARGEGAAAGASVRQRVLRHLEVDLRRSGLLYGSPKLPSRVAQGRRLDRAEALFLAVLAGECFVALDVARIAGRPFDPEEAEGELTLLLAASAGRLDLATAAARHMEASAARGKSLDRVQERLEAALLERVAPVTGDSVFDLPLHNAHVFGETRLIARLALDLYRCGRFRPAWARRLLGTAKRERARLFPALTAPTRRVRPLGEAQRRVLAKELRRLQGPRGLARVVRVVRVPPDEPPSPARLAGQVRTRAARRFVLEQTYLASMVGGEVDDGEARFLAELAAAFGFTSGDLDRIEAEVADYFYDPEDVLDAFEIRVAGQTSSEKLVDRIEREIRENLDRIALEAKETGELTQLMGKVAVGQKLTPEEKAKVREQLLDLAKVVPSLAIIAAPGGMLIFAALLKVLPFSLLPSSFQKPPAGQATRPRVRLPSRRRGGRS